MRGKIVQGSSVDRDTWTTFDLIIRAKVILNGHNISKKCYLKKFPNSVESGCRFRNKCLAGMFFVKIIDLRIVAKIDFMDQWGKYRGEFHEL